MVFTITLVLSACSISVLPTVDSGKFALLFRQNSGFREIYPLSFFSEAVLLGVQPS